MKAKVSTDVPESVAQSREQLEVTEKLTSTKQMQFLQPQERIHDRDET